jgi:hypothetical protein
MHFFGVDAIVGGGLNTLAVLAAEVMTVTNPLAFQTVLGWPGLQTIARFHYYPFFLRLIFAPCWCILWWHRFVGAWRSRECTFISQQPSGHVHIPLEKLQKRNALVFSCYRSKDCTDKVDSLARMGQVRQEEAEVEAAREHLDYLPIVFQPSLTTLDR